MTRARSDGLFFLVLGMITFLLFGAYLKYRATDSMVDFKSVYYASRALIQHSDPYNQKEFSVLFRTRFGESRFLERHASLGVSLNLPTTYFLLTPLAALPFRVASGLWSILTAITLIFAACLMWQMGRDASPIVTGVLTGLVLINCAVVMANGNTAGVIAGLCVIGAWSFIARRVLWLGILCLAISLVVKPQDAGLLWLFFLLKGGVPRKHALQTLGVAVLLGVTATVWVSRAAPHWLPEFRANMAESSARGGNNDPGPEGPTSISGTMEVVTDLQAVVSVFRDSPSFYNSITYLICGIILVVWSIATVRSSYTPMLSWMALAGIAPLTLLVTYHRAYDARLLLLAIPACAMLWAKGNRTGKAALAVTAAALIFTGEIPLAFLNPLLIKLHASAGSLPGILETVLLMRLAALSLLVMCLYYLWMYVREHRAASAVNSPAVTGREPAPAARS
jgi:hypothetical protein